MQILLFTSTTENCEYCEPTRQLLEEIAPLSDKLSLAVYDIVEASALAEQYHVDKTPGIALAGAQGEDFGIRIAGIPAGHQFTSLIYSLGRLVSRDSAA